MKKQFIFTILVITFCLCNSFTNGMSLDTGGGATVVVQARGQTSEHFFSLPTKVTESIDEINPMHIKLFKKDKQYPTHVFYSNSSFIKLDGIPQGEYRLTLGVGEYQIEQTILIL